MTPKGETLGDKFIVRETDAFCHRSLRYCSYITRTDASFQFYIRTLDCFVSHAGQFLSRPCTATVSSFGGPVES